MYAIEARGKYCPIIAENWPVGGLNVNSGEPADPFDISRVIPDVACGPGVLWQRGILTNPKILYCPAATEGPARADPAIWWKAPDWVMTFLGYAVYANYRSIGDTDNKLADWVADAAASPADRVVATDAMSLSDTPGWGWINHIDPRGALHRNQRRARSFPRRQHPLQ